MYTSELSPFKFTGFDGTQSTFKMHNNGHTGRKAYTEREPELEAIDFQNMHTLEFIMMNLLVDYEKAN